MGCYNPLHGIYDEVDGEKVILWTNKQGYEKVVVPCGKCVGCRLDYAKDWALRCVHEASMYEDNCFITLTYDEKHVPAELDVSIFQNFMKRLRRRYNDVKIRYFHAGEYGGSYGRPHHHAILFNFDFKDKVVSPRVVPLSPEKVVYESEELGDLWTFGFHGIAEVNFATAAYVAKYCVKKAESHMEIKKNEETGERVQVDKRSGEEKKAEFTTMSRRPGIGSTWFDVYWRDVYPHDSVVWKGREFRPPRYYDGLLDKIDGDMLSNIKVKRLGKLNFADNTDARLKVKEECKLAEIKRQRRRIDHDNESV